MLEGDRNPTPAWRRGNITPLWGHRIPLGYPLGYQPRKWAGTVARPLLFWLRCARFWEPTRRLELLTCCLQSGRQVALTRSQHLCLYHYFRGLTRISPTSEQTRSEGRWDRSANCGQNCGQIVYSGSSAADAACPARQSALLTLQCSRLTRGTVLLIPLSYRERRVTVNADGHARGPSERGPQCYSQGRGERADFRPPDRQGIIARPLGEDRIAPTILDQATNLGYHCFWVGLHQQRLNSLTHQGVSSASTSVFAPAHRHARCHVLLTRSSANPTMAQLTVHPGGTVGGKSGASTHPGVAGLDCPAGATPAVNARHRGATAPTGAQSGGWHLLSDPTSWCPDLEKFLEELRCWLDPPRGIGRWVPTERSRFLVNGDLLRNRPPTGDTRASPSLVCSWVPCRSCQ